MLKVSVKFQGDFPPAGSVERVMDRFGAEAGALIVEKVRGLLGTDALYTLSPEYAKRKRKDPRLRRVAGKPSDQPLILTSALYRGLHSWRVGDSVFVQVDEAMAHDIRSDFDYAELWEERTQYLDKGIALALPDLGPMLGRIIAEECLLKD